MRFCFKPKSDDVLHVFYDVEGLFLNVCSGDAQHLDEAQSFLLHQGDIVEYEWLGCEYAYNDHTENSYRVFHNVRMILNQTHTAQGWITSDVLKFTSVNDESCTIDRIDTSSINFDSIFGPIVHR